MFDTLVQSVLDSSVRTPEKLAVGFREIELTYARLKEQMEAAAAVLKEEYGIQAGDCVLLGGVSRPEFIVSFLGVQYLGATCIPVDKTALWETLLDICCQSGAKLLIGDMQPANGNMQTDLAATDNIRKVSLSGFYRKVQERGNDFCPKYSAPDKGNVAEILFTTGTTGRAKGVMLTFENVRAITRNMYTALEMSRDDILLIPLPLNHSLGLRNLRAALYVGATVILQNGLVFPLELRENLEHFHCNSMVCVPASVERLYRQMGDEFTETLENLSRMEVGAGSLSAGMKKTLRGLLPRTRIYNVWGSSETGGVIFLDVSGHPDKLSSLGKPVEGGAVQVRIVASDGKDAAARDIDTAGRLALSGPMCMIGYIGQPELTAKSIVDGWLYTNDMVYRDEDGYLYMIGRADDIINVGGEKVSPVEVEDAASEFEKIRECACVGVSDPEGVLGQVPVLFYVAEQSVDTFRREFLSFLSRRLEAYKIPRHFIWVDEIPRNRMKKLDRGRMRQIWEESKDTDLMNPVMRGILGRKSVRVFTQDRVPKTILDMIIKAGIQAPSGHNRQTWHFLVIQDRDEIQKLNALVKKTAEEKNVFFYGMNEPDTFIVISNDRRNTLGLQDSAVAAENMMIAAHSYGLGSVWVNAVAELGDEPEIRERLTGLGVPEKHKVWAGLAIGYPDGKTKDIQRKTDVVSWVGQV